MPLSSPRAPGPEPRLAISNIAWDAHEDDGVLGELPRWKADGIEVAPTKIWPGWEGIVPAAVERYRRRVESFGLAISGIQAVFFGKPDCKLLGRPEEQAAFAEHLVLVTGLARDLGAGAVVLGAPKNRIRGDLSLADAITRAAAVLSRVMPQVERQGVWVGVEPNPPTYGGDFVFTLDEAARLAHAVGSPAFGVHVDAGAIITSRDDLTSFLAKESSLMRYFHISEPMLGDFHAPSPEHAAIGRLLAASPRKLPWLSIEMRRKEVPASLREAIDFARATYLAPVAEPPGS